MHGYEIHQIQQAILGLNPRHYSSGSVTKGDDVKHTFLDDLHTTVMSGIENTKIKYNIKNNKNNANDIQQIDNENEKIANSSINKAVETVKERQKRHAKYDDYDDYIRNFPIRLYTKDKTNATYVSEVANYARIKGDFHFYVYNLQHTQKRAIELFQKTLEIANPIINKLSHINTIIKQFYNKQITYIAFQEHYIREIYLVNDKIKDIKYLAKNNEINQHVLYDKILEYDQKITKNVETNSSILDLSKDIMKIGDDVIKLLRYFIILHTNCKVKYEHKIKSYTYNLKLYENIKSTIDKTMINYNEYLTIITYEIASFNEEKEKLYHNLGLLENCMKKKDNIISDLKRLEVMHCQNTQENDKQDLILEGASKEHICDIDNQQNIQNVLHAIIEQNCVGLQKDVVTYMVEQPAELKQCNGDECEVTEANGVSTYEKATKDI
ncbi:hypothetical protein BDAP_000363 [Binucleata daphniae]